MTKEQAKEILWNRCQHTPETAEAIRVLSEERPKLTDEQIEQIIDLLENEWGYEGIREDVERILNGEIATKLQGEWLWLGDNPNPNHKWSCNKCGRGVKEQENFCPNCGLKMQKGDAE